MVLDDSIDRTVEADSRRDSGGAGRKQTSENLMVIGHRVLVRRYDEINLRGAELYARAKTGH